MKAFQEPSVLTRSVHHTAEGHRGISKVPISPPADMCFRARGIRYGGGKIQLFSFNQENCKRVNCFTSWVAVSTTEPFQLSSLQACKTIHCVRAPQLVDISKAGRIIAFTSLNVELFRQSAEDQQPLATLSENCTANPPQPSPLASE